MADVTINQLPDLAVTGTNFLVHTNGTTTGKATVNTLRTALSIPAAQVQSDWNQANNASLDFIKNKPTIGMGGIQLFTSSGTFTVPVGVLRVRVTCVGGGGGAGGNGGCTSRGCTRFNFGGRGGGGGAAISVLNVTPSTQASITITPGSGAQANGGNATFTYGSNNLTGGGGGAGGLGCCPNNGADGAPGAGSGGQVNITGYDIYPGYNLGRYGIGGIPVDVGMPAGSPGRTYNTGVNGAVLIEW